MNNQSDENKKEGIKLTFEAYKHLITVCTGSILLLVTFLKNIVESSNSAFLAVVAVFLLFITIVMSILVLLLLAKLMRNFGQEDPEPEKTKKWGTIAVGTSIVSFLFGILLLFVFFMVNI